MKGNGGASLVAGRGINRAFPHKACINLDRRPERWTRMLLRFAEHGIGSVMRFPAIDGANLAVPAEWAGAAGAYGCSRSNIALVKHARANGWPSVLIFEDDVGFDPSFTLKFPRFFAQVPSDWDMLFFGGMHRDEPLKVSENVVRLTGTTSTYAYALNESIYDAFIELNNRILQPVDVNNYELQRRFNCYCFLPHLAWADADYSDTHGRAVNPWWLKESLVLGGAEMSRVQSSTTIIIPHRDRTAGGRGIRNLKFIVDHYCRFLSGAKVIVVEHDDVSSIRPGDLPDECSYRLIDDGSQFDRARCFNAGLEMTDASCEFFIFVDRDLCSSWDLKAALKKCQDYAFVSSFNRVFELDEQDTTRVIGGKLIDTVPYSPRSSLSICSEFCVFTRQAIEELDGWEESDPETNDLIQSRKVNERLSVFETPGWALRLNAEA